MNAPTTLTRDELLKVDRAVSLATSERMVVTDKVKLWSARYQADLIRVIAEQFHGTDASDALYDAADAIDLELLREDRELNGGNVGDASGWTRSAMENAR